MLGTCCAQRWREEWWCAKWGAFCLQGVKTRTASQSDKGGIPGKRHERGHVVSPAVKLAEWSGWEDWVELSSFEQSFSVWSWGWAVVGGGNEPGRPPETSYLWPWKPLPPHPGVIQVLALFCVLCDTMKVWKYPGTLFHLSSIDTLEILPVLSKAVSTWVLVTLLNSNIIISGVIVCTVDSSIVKTEGAWCGRGKGFILETVQSEEDKHLPPWWI